VSDSYWSPGSGCPQPVVIQSVLGPGINAVKIHWDKISRSYIWRFLPIQETSYLGHNNACEAKGEIAYGSFICGCTFSESSPLLSQTLLESPAELQLLLLATHEPLTASLIVLIRHYFIIQTIFNTWSILQPCGIHTKKDWSYLNVSNDDSTECGVIIPVNRISQQPLSTSAIGSGQLYVVIKPSASLISLSYSTHHII
jgi:hypothetical protein